jgi:translocation protein SEC63
MASYTYDESGNMALFFIITILFMILVPVTLSQISSSQGTCGPPCISQDHPLTCGPLSGSEIPSAACECSACVDKRARIRMREKGSILRPNISKKCVLSSLYRVPRLTPG